MFKSITAEELFHKIDEFVNYSGRTHYDELIRLLTNKMHRTLKQSFFNFVIGYIKAVADDDFDLRNEASVKLAKQLVDALQNPQELRELTQEAKDIEDLLQHLKTEDTPITKELQRRIARLADKLATTDWYSSHNLTLPMY